MALRIGVHPNNLHLVLARSYPDIFDGQDVEMVPYAEGRDSAALLGGRMIDVCGTGSTPPILAQAAGINVTYLAASAPRPANGGLIVAAASAITGVGDLRGARVALLDGSFHTYLLARELENVGLRLADCERVELSPAASLRALQGGEVDAWVAMAPLLDQSIAAGSLRLLTRCGDTIPNRSVFWTIHGLGVANELLDMFVAGLMRLGRDIATDPLRAAQSLAGLGAAKADIAAWQETVSGRDWSIEAASPQIIAEQQNEADTLARHGFLPPGIDFASALRQPALAG